MKTEININGVNVDLIWDEGQSESSLGQAFHTVDEDAMKQGTAEGPSDGTTFEIDGTTYELGQHSYETEDGETTCVADIYLVETD